LAASAGSGPAAFAQPRAARNDTDVIKLIGDFVSSMTASSRDKVSTFLETVEVWDAEPEIDRLVGDPWRLHDSTAYKLRLLPLYLTSPVYGQLVNQMTRLDDRGALRIQNVTPDSVEGAAVRFDALDAGRRPQDFSGALLGHFSAREFIDLTVFGLAQQPLFPTDEQGWQELKHHLAQRKLTLAAGALSAGALFNVGAFARSGGIVSSADRTFGLGWYGGIRSLGVQLQPLLRGGVTARMPGFEASAGLSERVRPDDRDRRRALEVALRDGWLNRWTRRSGWDAFVELAWRQVLDAGALYDGEVTTGRAGVFARREGTAQLAAFVFRSSAEVESDFSENARFVGGVGFEHRRTGLAAVLQSSRTAVVSNGVRTPETRGGLFVAGTVESPSRFLVDGMAVLARQTREDWEAAVAQGGAAGPSEVPTVRLAATLCGYLESRRAVYAILRRDRPPGELYGPLDPSIMLKSRDLVLERHRAVLTSLASSGRRLFSIDRRLREVRDEIERLGNDAPLLAAYRAELASLESALRLESHRVRGALAAHEAYRAGLRRMAAATSRFLPVWDLDPLKPAELRRLTMMTVLAPR
jgi:hypothetical protein